MPGVCIVARALREVDRRKAERCHEAIARGFDLFLKRHSTATAPAPHLKQFRDETRGLSRIGERIMHGSSLSSRGRVSIGSSPRPARKFA
jgi:hypothetical protein